LRNGPVDLGKPSLDAMAIDFVGIEQCPRLHSSILPVLPALVKLHFRPHFR
jgi:hypothetical protein